MAVAEVKLSLRKRLRLGNRGGASGLRLRGAVADFPRCFCDSAHSRPPLLQPVGLRRGVLTITYAVFMT